MNIKPVSYNVCINTNTINKSIGNINVHNDEKYQFSLSSYHYPVSFYAKTARTYSSDNKKLAETPSKFKVCQRNDIPCPACGRKMLTRSKYEGIVEELHFVPPEEYLNYLGRYQDYMRPVELSVYEELCQLSEKNGSKDIRTLLVELRNSKLPLLQKAQMVQLKKMRSLARTLPDDEKEILESKVLRLRQEIKNNKEMAPFRRKAMIDEISKVQIRNPRKYQKLQAIAKNFPTSTDMNSAWIVKYSGKNKLQEDWDSFTIATRLLASSVANTDHIIAYNLERNHDDISNYMAMHNACNSHKANKTFLEWLNEDRDNRIKYMKDYFEAVDEQIKTKRISKKKYKNYVAKATETIFTVSKGEIDLRPKETVDVNGD